MTNMNRQVYEALHAAQGVTDEQAQAAAESIADYSQSFAGFAKDVAGRFDRFDARLDSFDARLNSFEARLERFDGRLNSFDTRLARVERDMLLLKWMVGAVLLGVFAPIVKAMM